jgi:hypothetical protein
LPCSLQVVYIKPYDSRSRIIINSNNNYDPEKGKKFVKTALYLLSMLMQLIVACLAEAQRIALAFNDYAAHVILYWGETAVPAGDNWKHERTTAVGQKEDRICVN